nr:C25 family cysteine peptidase [Candidatus Freyarchaeota archaeon]
MVRWFNLKRKRGKVVLAILMISLFLFSINLLTTLNQLGQSNTLTSYLIYASLANNYDSPPSGDYELEISTQLDAKDINYCASGYLTLRFEISSFDYGEGLYYFDSCKFLRCEGLPVLPYTLERVILPLNSVIENLQVDCEEQEYLKPKYLERFNRTGTQICGGEGEEPDVRQVPLIFPDKPVIVSDSPLITRAGVSLWHIAIYPFQVFQNETVLLHKEMTIRIYFKPDNSIAQSRYPESAYSEFIKNSLSKFSGSVSEPQLKQGTRVDVKGKPSFIVIGDQAMHSMAVAYSFYWTPEGSKHYGLVCLKPDETNLIPESSMRLQALGFDKPQIIDSPADLIALIESSWKHAPYLVIADEKLSASAAPLAAFLNYPLIVQSAVTNEEIGKLINQLGASGIISCGNATNSHLGNLTLIELANEEEVNQFFCAFQYQSGFIEKEFDAYRDQFLKTVLNGHDYTILAGKEPQTRQGVPYLVCCDNSAGGEFKTAAQMLASYRNATIVNVSSKTSAEIRDLLNYYDPLYVAFYGDGDDGEAGCYFVSDPIGSSGDPALVATDFYYGERNQCQPNETLSWFSVDSYVGRPIATNDYYSQLYVDLVAAYENGSLTSYNYTKRCALFSYGFGLGDATWNIYNIVVAIGATYHPVYTRDSGTFTDSRVLWELDYGIQIAYFNTHGSYESISMGDGGYLTDNDLQGRDFSSQPPFIYVDACLTARFAGEREESTCIATQFMNYGILGYLGSTMLAYVGDFDRFDQHFFGYFGTNESLGVGLITGSALEDFYWSAVYDYGGFDKYEQMTILEVMLVGDPKLEMQFYGVLQPSQLPSLLPFTLAMLAQSAAGTSLGTRIVQIFGVIVLIGISMVAVMGTGKYAEPADWYTPWTNF